MKATLITASIIIVAILFVIWTEKHDEAMMATYSAYDNCVQATYGQSASSYYQEHGEMPECK